MKFLRPLQFLLVLGLATAVTGQEAPAKEEPKPKTRRFFLFKRDSKEEEKPQPEAPKKEPPPEPKKEEPKKEEPKKADPKKDEVPKPKADPKPATPAGPKPTPPEPMPTAAKPESKPAPKPEPESKPQPRPEAKPQSKSEPKPEPKAESKPEPKPQPKPEPKAEPPNPPVTPKEKPPEAPAAGAAPMESKSPPPPAPVTPSLSPDPVEAKQEAVITQVHSAIRAAGQQVEKVRKRRDEEPGGIAAKVDSLLKGPGPVRMRQTLRVEQTLKVLRRPTIAFQFVSKIHTGTRGFTFDDSEDGRQSLIEELYRVKTEGVREVERLLQLRRLSAGQGRSDVAKAMAERAVLAARAHVSQRPQDAHAHALLAETLATTGEDGRKEMLQEIGTALRLEADHPRALLVRLEDQVARLREYLLREGPRGLHMPPRDPQEVMRRLYAQPPTEAALQAHEAASAEIRSLIVRIMDRASGKPEWMLRACAALMLPPLDVEFAELARSGKARSFEHFSQSAAEIENSGAWTRMEKVGWITQLQRVLDSVGEDGQMIAVISAVPALWGSGQPGRSSSDRLFWTAVPEKLREFFDRGMSRAAAIGRKDDSITAAKACEAVACLEFAAASFGAKVRHEGLALRAISLDPWRVHALDLLTATLAPGFPNAAQALTEIRLAVLDGYSSHQRCAAAADHAGDWASAERHLQACVKLRPTSLEALSYLIAIRLCEDQTPERFAEVQQRFDSARSVYSEQQDSISPQVAEAFIMNYIVFLCLQEDWKSATDVFAISAAGGRLSEAAAKEAALLIQSR